MIYHQTTEEFVAKAKAVWGDEYDYKWTVYRGPLQRVKIICRVHGMFEQLPYNHLDGHRCYQCSREAYRLTTAEFVERARALFGEYDYSQVNYQQANIKVTIICPAHGPFQRRPADLLLKRRGCPVCSRKKRPKRGAKISGLTLGELALVREVLSEYRPRALRQALAQRESW